MRIRQLAAAAAFSVVLSAPYAYAQGTGAQGIFTIHNATSQNTVTGFYTNDGSGWSTNWLSEPIPPGESSEARFHANTGPCEQTFQIGWLGESSAEVLDDPIDIDICDASNVYLEDNNITYD